MANKQQLSNGTAKPAIFWVARALSIVVAGGFSLLLFSSMAGGDKPKPEGAELLFFIPLFLAILGCLLAWRWQKIGGSITIIAAVILSAVGFLISMEFGGYITASLVVLIYGLPFILVGVLFHISSKAVHQSK